MSRKIEMRIATTSIYWALTSVLQGELVIPEFQREYVWTKDNVEELVDSLVKQYPIGAITTIGAAGLPLLPIKDVWLTQEGIDACHKRVVDRGIKPDYLYVLDGAQRLQTLYKLCVSGDYRLLYNPVTDHWKVLTAEQQERDGDVFPYISITEIYAYHFSRDGMKLGANWRDLDKVRLMLSRPALAPCKDPHLNRISRKTSSLTLWRYRMHEEMMRYRTRERCSCVENEDELLDQYNEANQLIRELPDVPSTLRGAEYTAKQKSDRKKEIQRIERSNAAALRSIRERFKEALEIGDNKEDADKISHFTDMIEIFEEKLLSRANLAMNRFSLGEGGSLKEAVKVFKRINMAGVPVDMSFLDKLAEEEK